jgi:LysM repeat protein
MDRSKNKVRLSPQLKLGVGRGYSKNNLLKYSGFAFLFASLALGIWTVQVVLHRSSTTDSPTAQNNTANPQVLGATDTKATPFFNYTVQKGDTVFNIAQKYNINWSTLATINNLSSPFTLKPGQVLKVPNQ